MVGLWAYAAGIGATNKYNQIKDEQRNLAGQKEIDILQTKLLNASKTEENDVDPSLFSLKGTNISFNLPTKDELAIETDQAAKRFLHTTKFLDGILGYDKETWDSIVNSPDDGIKSEYARMEEKFLGSVGNFWKYIGTTDAQSPIYKKFYYDRLREVLPGLYNKVAVIDPIHDPEEDYNPDFEKDWNVNVDGVKFTKDTTMEDVIHIPYKFGKSSQANIEGFNNHYGIDFGKDVLMSGQYASWTEQQYENAKANSPWAILIPTYMAMIDDDKLSMREGRRSIVEIQLAYGLDDEELIKTLSRGTRKYDLNDRGGNQFARIKIGQVSPQQASRAQNSRSGAMDIIEKVNRMQRYIGESEATKLGFSGWVRKFFKGTIGDETSQLNEFRKMIGTVRDSSMDVWDGDTFAERKATKKFYMDELEKGVNQYQELYKNHGTTIDLWKIDETADTEKVTQSMIDTLAIGLAFSIALTEQGSGGKAVSDNDFKVALQRVKGEWFTSKSEALGALNEIKHDFKIRWLKEKILSSEYKTHGNSLLVNYESIIKARNEYLNELKKDFITVGAVEFSDRTQRLIDMYTNVGGSQDNVLYKGSSEVIAKSAEQEFGKKPDVLKDEGFQYIFSQMTESERYKVTLRLGSKEDIQALEDQNKKKNGIGTTIKIFQDYDKISKGYTVPKPIKGKNAVAFTQTLLRQNPGALLLKDAIDISVARYQYDKMPLFGANIDIPFETEEEVRMYVLKQWLMRYQKQDQDIFLKTQSQTGIVQDPQNEDTLRSIYNKFWGEQ